MSQWWWAAALCGALHLGHMSQSNDYENGRLEHSGHGSKEMTVTLVMEEKSK